MSGARHGMMAAPTDRSDGQSSEAKTTTLVPTGEYEELVKKLEQLQGEVGELNKKLEGAQYEAKESKDKYLRALADGENARKRIRQQAEESTRVQRESLLRDLLPIVDNLERAVDAARGGGNGDSIVTGVEMVLRSLLDFLKSQGVTQVSAAGQPFDPSVHEAVDHVETAALPPSTVVEEFHRGYKVGERVLRPARVSVAKSVPQRNDSENN